MTHKFQLPKKRHFSVNGRPLPDPFNSISPTNRDPQTHPRGRYSRVVFIAPFTSEIDYKCGDKYIYTDQLSPNKNACDYVLCPRCMYYIVAYGTVDRKDAMMCICKCQTETSVSDWSANGRSRRVQVICGKCTSDIGNINNDILRFQDGVLSRRYIRPLIEVVICI